MACFKWNKKGASSTIQFGLCHTKLDPGFVALLDTVITFRVHGTPDVAFPVLNGLVNTPPRHFDPGPCGVLLARLHDIQWQWDGNGFLLDHEGLPVHLIDSPIQYLKIRLKHAWERQVGSLMSERKDFEGLGWVDVEASHPPVPMTGEDRGILRSIHNGTFYTRDKQIHAGKVPSKDCPYCQQPDGLQHRIWQCEFFADLRDRIPQTVREFLSTQPDCTRLHAWMIQEWPDFQWRSVLCQLPSPAQSCYPEPPSDHILHLFCDGGCLYPTQPRLRLASWAFCIADLQNDTFLPGGSGLLEGPLQSSLRAEVRAALDAFQYAWTHRREFVLWLDNQLVHDRIQQFRTGIRGRPSLKQADHDLWERLYSWVNRCRHLLFDVIKVVSHMDVDAVEGTIDKWVVSGNDMADRLASAALVNLPVAVGGALARVHSHLQDRRDASFHLQKFLLAMGQRDIAAKEVTQSRDENEWDRAQHQINAQSPEASLCPLPETFEASSPHTLGPCFAPLSDWVRRLVSGNDTCGMWLCNYQLLVHFQRTTGKMGFWYDRPRKEWRLADDLAREQGFDFCRYAAWLLAALKVFAKTCQLPMTIQPSMPWGTCFRSWQRCIYVQASVTDFTMVDSQLSARVAVALKSIQPLRNTADFCNNR